MRVRTLHIDGRMMTGAPGETIFQVAWNNGIHIPRLCHIGSLSDVGACRLCLVEVEGQGRFQPACMTPVREGMVVHTDTETLRKHRKWIVELLLAERNHICSVCVTNGACELQALAASMGIDHVRVRYRNPKLPALDLTHERYGLDHNRCILCTRCVRVCDEVEGSHTWDVAGRGVNSRVICDLGGKWGESETCTSCGKCVQVCPTGALFSKGSSVGEMKRDRSFLRYIVTAREKKQWVR